MFASILAFLGIPAAGADWRALDDSINEFPAKCTQLVACDPNRGFEVPQMQALRRWLT